MAELTPRVVLDDAALLKMSVDPKFLKDFPFLKAVAPVKTGCGSCRRRSDVTRATRFLSIRSAIANLKPDSKKRLKELLQTKQVEVHHQNHQKKVIKLLF